MSEELNTIDILGIDTQIHQKFEKEEEKLPEYT